MWSYLYEWITAENLLCFCSEFPGNFKTTMVDRCTKVCVCVLCRKGGRASDNGTPSQNSTLDVI